MSAPSELRIRLLGGLEVEGIPLAEVGSRKARTVVKVLALGRGSVVPTGAVIEALWPSDAPARPVEQVRVLVSRLRKSLGGPRLIRNEVGWALRVDWLDVAELEARAAEAGERLDAGQHASARAAAQAAVELLRGPLVPAEDGAWVAGDRGLCERWPAGFDSSSPRRRGWQAMQRPRQSTPSRHSTLTPSTRLRCGSPCGRMPRAAGQPQLSRCMPGCGVAWPRSSV